MKQFTVFISLLSICFLANAQDTEKFPASIIDSSIIEKRGYEEQIEMLKNECDWKNRIGKEIDVFWLQTMNGSRFGYVYEYFMDCDNLRLIYWYDNAARNGKPVDFLIENLEDESAFVVAKKKHLKNKKKYQHLLEKK